MTVWTKDPKTPKESLVAMCSAAGEMGRRSVVVYSATYSTAAKHALMTILRCEESTWDEYD
jgi:hypothetical protein